MPAILSTIILPAVTQGPGIFSRLLVSARRDREGMQWRFDGRESPRSSRNTLSGQADEEMATFATAMEPRGRQRAPTLEVAPWS
jgi:hypothetical protein